MFELTRKRKESEKMKKNVKTLFATVCRGHCLKRKFTSVDYQGRQRWEEVWDWVKTRGIVLEGITVLARLRLLKKKRRKLYTLGLLVAFWR